MGSSSLANEGGCVCERERDSGLRNSTALGGKVCVCERERDSGLSNSMARGGKGCVRERERFWVKE